MMRSTTRGNSQRRYTVLIAVMTCIAVLGCTTPPLSPVTETPPSPITELPPPPRAHAVQSYTHTSDELPFTITCAQSCFIDTTGGIVTVTDPASSAVLTIGYIGDVTFTGAHTTADAYITYQHELNERAGYVQAPLITDGSRATFSVAAHYTHDGTDAGTFAVPASAQVMFMWRDALVYRLIYPAGNDTLDAVAASMTLSAA